MEHSRAAPPAPSRLTQFTVALSDRLGERRTGGGFVPPRRGRGAVQGAGTAELAAVSGGERRGNRDWPNRHRVAQLVMAVASGGWWSRDALARDGRHGHPRGSHCGTRPRAPCEQSPQRRHPNGPCCVVTISMVRCRYRRGFSDRVARGSRRLTRDRSSRAPADRGGGLCTGAPRGLIPLSRRFGERRWSPAR